MARLSAGAVLGPNSLEEQNVAGVILVGRLHGEGEACADVVSFRSSSRGTLLTSFQVKPERPPPRGAKL